jgi:hypothetical protein
VNVVGGIYRVHTSLVKPPKEKIVLYVGDGLFLWFNTVARQRPGQLCTQAAECPEITRECYLDCGRVTVFSDAELAKASYFGTATVAFLARVIEEVELRATVLVNAHRKLVAENLRNRRGDSC